MRIPSILFILAILMLSSCKDRPEIVYEDFESQSAENSMPEVKEVLYSMYLPTDMADVFTQSGSNYFAEIPASINDIPLYTYPEQIALMLGIYGVDLTYIKLMGQSQAAAQYYKAIETLSGKINIPNQIFSESSAMLEKYFSNEDSLAFVIDEIYRKTDIFFKEKGQNNLAAHSLVGGWVEAMYIGVSIFDSNRGNTVMAERILQQKYSLNSLYTILSNYQESLPNKELLLMLKKLRKVFDKVDIKYQKEGFSVDTTQKKLQSLKAQIRYDEKTMDDLIRIIPLVREEIISPQSN